MQREEKERLMRVFILDTLVSQSGKQLTPDVIGQLTEELLNRMIEVLNRDNEYK